MVTTDDGVAAAAEPARFGYDRNFGERKIPGIYDVVALGHNFRMSEVQAAVGIGQLEQLDGFLEARRRNTKILQDGFAGLDGVVTFATQRGKASSACYCMNIVFLDRNFDRNGLIERLNATGIGTSVHYPVAVPLTRYYRDRYGHQPGDFPVAEWISSKTISLPVGPHVSAEDARYIAETVRVLVKEAIAA